MDSKSDTRGGVVGKYATSLEVKARFIQADIEEVWASGTFGQLDVNLSILSKYAKK